MSAPSGTPGRRDGSSKRPAPAGGTPSGGRPGRRRDDRRAGSGSTRARAAASAKRAGKRIARAANKTSPPPKKITLWIILSRGIPRLLLVAVIWAIFAMFLNYGLMPLYVREGSAEPIPDLRGKSVTAARGDTDEADLQLEIKDERFVAGTPAGIVIDQFPAPGVHAKPGRRVQVILSTGVPTTEVPKLTGVNADEARYRVEAAGLVVSGVGYTFSESVFDGQVKGQSPRAGSIVDRHSAVSFTVSLGPEPDRFVVPDVLDVPYDQALYLIRKAGLKPGEVTWERYVGRPLRAVMVQQPPPDTPAQCGDTVDLIINGAPRSNSSNRGGND